MNDSRKRAALCIVLITLVLGIFMGPGLIGANDTDIIKEFAHAYFNTSPEEYRLLYPDNEYGKNVEKKYIKNQFDNLVTKKAMESILKEESFVSHVRRAHIKKVELEVEKMKITILRHDTWRNIYSVDGYVKSVKKEDGTTEQLRFMGQLGLTEVNGEPQIDNVLMMIDEAVYYNNRNW